MADGSKPQTREIELQYREMLVREIRPDAREADFVCSTEAVDSYETIVKQDWDLKRYRANPVVLYSHCAKDKPIGQARNVRVEGNELLATVWFSQATQHAEECWQLVKERTLRGISVGFDPKSVTCDEESDVVILSKNELYELSVTPLPSNPEALQRLRARAIAARSDGGATQTKTTPAERGAEKDSPMPTEKETALEARVTELSSNIRSLEEKAREAEKAKSDLDLRARALEDQNGLLVKERDALKERAEAAEGTLIEREVDALVGKKFTAAERDGQVMLAKRDVALWRTLTAQRSDMPHSVQIIPEDGKAPPSRLPTSPAEAQASSERAAAEFFASIQSH